MWEVYRSNCRMAVDTCDWSLVSFKHLTDSSFAVLEYITKVNLSGNHTSTDRDSTEMQFKYSHEKIFCCFVWTLPCCKRLHQNRSQKIRLEYGPWLQHVFPANLKCHDMPQEEETNSAGTSPTFGYTVLQAIAKTSIHTKNKIQSSGMSMKLPLT